MTIVLLFPPRKSIYSPRISYCGYRCGVLHDVYNLIQFSICIQERALSNFVCDEDQEEKFCTNEGRRSTCQVAFEIPEIT